MNCREIQAAAHAEHMALGHAVMVLDQAETRAWAARGYPPITPDDDVVFGARWNNAGEASQLAVIWSVMEAKR